jgi:hypothetical protein
MATVFISHAEEDQALALEIAGGLERAGYSTWYYQRDSSPGLSYLLQVNRAIEACQFVVLVISERALASTQITAEVVRAHETGKSFVPVRSEISHEEFQRRKPEWNMAVGAAGSIAVPQGGVPAILPQIIAGLGLLSGERKGRAVPSAERAPQSTPSRRTWTTAGAIGVALVLLALYGYDRGWVTRHAPSPAASTAVAPSLPATGLPGAVEAEVLSAPKATAPPPVATRSRSTPEPGPRCEESRPGVRDVDERGRLEARDDVSEHSYEFVICEERLTASGAVEMRVISSNTVGTRWSDETAARRAEDMERRGVDCEPTGTAVRSTGTNDPRRIVYVLCQASGQPTSIEVHATTRKADGSAYPLKILRAPWPM